MRELDMIRAFAKLDGMDICPSHQEQVGVVVLDNSKGLMGMIKYNPITDLALNCAARDKYEVSIEYGTHSDFISIDCELYSEVMDKNIIPHAVIECILKSEGKWIG